MNKVSYFLVTHGSRNPSAVEFLHNLVKLAQAKSENLVGGGLLEGQELSLSQQLVNFGKVAQAQGYAEILILPIFLLAGVHVCDDLPEQVAIAQKISELKFKLVDRFGAYSQIPQLLKTKFPQDASAKILLAHGSRLSETTKYLENLAQNLNAMPAYWSIAPSLETQIEQLINLGHSEITILPYFLASGGIMEAIANKISNYSISIQLLELPFQAEAIAKLVINYAQSCTLEEK